MKLFGLEINCGCDARRAWMIKQFRRLMLKAAGFSHLGFGEPFLLAEGHLTASIHRASGQTDQLDLGYNTITDAAVAYLVDDFDNGGFRGFGGIALATGDSVEFTYTLTASCVSG